MLIYHACGGQWTLNSFKSVLQKDFGHNLYVDLKNKPAVDYKWPIVKTFCIRFTKQNLHEGDKTLALMDKGSIHFLSAQIIWWLLLNVSIL